MAGNLSAKQQMILDYLKKGIKQNGSDQALRPFLDIQNPPADEHGLSAYIEKLARLRCEQNALKYGGYRTVYLEYRRPFIFERFYENERIFTAVNIAGHAQTVNLAAKTRAPIKDLLTGELYTPDNIALPPHSALILKAE